jgi:uncharacterized protein
VNHDQAVVCDAGPLIVLAKLNLLYLLIQLYNYVHIVDTVYDEVVLQGQRQGYADAKTVQIFLQDVGWHPEIVVPDQLNRISPEIQLDRGELETLALAYNHRPALVLMDEYWGRKVARQLGLPVRGTLGILISAYRKQFIDAQQLRLYFSEMLHRQDIWINPRLIERLSKKVLGDTNISPLSEEQ